MADSKPTQLRSTSSSSDQTQELQHREAQQRPVGLAQDDAKWAAISMLSCLRSGAVPMAAGWPAFSDIGAILPGQLAQTQLPAAQHSTALAVSPDSGPSTDSAEAQPSLTAPAGTGASKLCGSKRANASNSSTRSYVWRRPMKTLATVPVTGELPTHLGSPGTVAGPGPAAPGSPEQKATAVDEAEDAELNAAGGCDKGWAALTTWLRANLHQPRTAKRHILFVGTQSHISRRWVFNLNPALAWDDVMPETRLRLRTLPDEVLLAFKQKYPHRPPHEWQMKSQRYRPGDGQPAVEVPMGELIPSMAAIWAKHEGGGPASMADHQVPNGPPGLAQSPLSSLPLPLPLFPNMSTCMDSFNFSMPMSLGPALGGPIGTLPGLMPMPHPSAMSAMPLQGCQPLQPQAPLAANLQSLPPPPGLKPDAAAASQQAPFSSLGQAAPINTVAGATGQPLLPSGQVEVPPPSPVSKPAPGAPSTAGAGMAKAAAADSRPLTAPQTAVQGGMGGWVPAGAAAPGGAGPALKASPAAAAAGPQAPTAPAAHAAPAQAAKSSAGSAATAAAAATATTASKDGAATGSLNAVPTPQHAAASTPAFQYPGACGPGFGWGMAGAAQQMYHPMMWGPQYQAQYQQYQQYQQQCHQYYQQQQQSQQAGVMQGAPFMQQWGAAAGMVPGATGWGGFAAASQQPWGCAPDPQLYQAAVKPPDAKPAPAAKAQSIYTCQGMPMQATASGAGTATGWPMVDPSSGMSMGVPATTMAALSSTPASTAVASSTSAPASAGLAGVGDAGGAVAAAGSGAVGAMQSGGQAHGPLHPAAAALAALLLVRSISTDVAC